MPYLVLMLSLLIAACVHQQPLSDSCASGDREICQAELELTQMLNLYRRQRGLSPIVHDQSAVIIARKRSIQQINNGDISHRGFPKDHERFASLSGMSQMNFSAENLASFRIGRKASPRFIARKFMDLWIQSPTHRRNLESSFRSYGASMVRQGDKWVATALFL